MENYQRLDDKIANERGNSPENVTDILGSASRFPTASTASSTTPSGVYVAAQPSIQFPPIKVYAHKTLKILAAIQLIFSVLILLGTIICFVVSATGRYSIPPVDGTGLWNGVLGIIAASFGITATVRMRQKGRCLMVTYFSLSIIVCVGMGIVVIMSGLYASVHANRYSYGNGAAFALNISIGVLAALHLISAIISLVLIRYNWDKNGIKCCGSRRKGGCCSCCCACCTEDTSTPAILYIPSNSAAYQTQFGQQSQTQYAIAPANSSLVQPQMIQSSQAQGETGPGPYMSAPPEYSTLMS